MPELLHKHVPIRATIIYNVHADKTQIIYICASQKLGCSWSHIIQLDGDPLFGRVGGLKQAEAALSPQTKEPDANL